MKFKKMKIYKEYFNYVMEHKRNVWKTCKARGLYLQGITHDLSKFSLFEFFAYAEYFYGEYGVKCKDKYGTEVLKSRNNIVGIKYQECCFKFEKAWQHHYLNNKHHWNYWLSEDDMALPMPDKYMLEMICDWEAMALKFGDSAQEFYLKNYKKIKLNPQTRIELEFQLGINDSMLHNYGHTLEDFVYLYDRETFESYFDIEQRYGIDFYGMFDKTRLVMPNDEYMHFKGNKYTVIEIAEDTETGFKKVVYKNEAGKVYVRDYDMFTSEVDFDKYPNATQKYRFEKINK